MGILWSTVRLAGDVSGVAYGVVLYGVGVRYVVGVVRCGVYVLYYMRFTDFLFICLMKSNILNMVLLMSLEYSANFAVFA